MWWSHLIFDNLDELIDTYKSHQDAQSMHFYAEVKMRQNEKKEMYLYTMISSKSSASQ